MKTKLAIFILALLAAECALGCSVPVFRYALERWPPDQYLAIVVHRGALASNDAALLNKLTSLTQEAGAALANMDVRTVDLATQADEPVIKPFEAEIKKGLPRVLVLYPTQGASAPEGLYPDISAPLDLGGPFGPSIPSITPGGPLAWAGPLEAATVETLADSPARREIVHRLLKGDSIVWVLVESGNKDQDQQAFESLQTELKKLEGDLSAAATNTSSLLGYPGPDEAAPFLLPETVPVNIAFSILRVARTDPAEAVFISMLMHSEADLDQGIGQPMAFPVFGQGRVLYALVGRGINREHIGDACFFLVGNCSCQVKALNPGTDLLMTADWTTFSGPSAFAPEYLPDLTGVLPEEPATTTAAAVTSTPGQIETAPPPESAPTPLPDQNAGAGKQEPSAPKIPKVVLALAVAFVLVISAVSMWLLRRNRE
ncbi:MAG: hypothetical protein HYV35_08700 [Lentisphaerae bacterium]|nr:hypothetical protein [Lentisphaerota bacterium]